MALLLSVYLKKHFIEGQKLKNALIILGAVSFVGVVWEFAEYIANLALSPLIYETWGIRTYFMGDLNDTINDLLMDILGSGTLICILHFFRGRKSHQLQTNLQNSPDRIG